MAERKVVWTTKLVQEAAQKIDDGIKLLPWENPFFENTIGLRKKDLVFMATEEELHEYLKAKTDIMYFAEKYCWVKGEDGKPAPIRLRKYQKEILQNFNEYRFNILMASRQSGKTICSSISLLHFMLFNSSKNVLLTANKVETVVEVLDKIKEIYSQLPFFLQKGIKVFNQRQITFDNKSRAKTSAATKSAAIGNAIDYWYADEFAYIPDNIAMLFYKSVFPTISSMTNSKITITSTPCGFNLFHKLLTDAERPDGDPEKNNFFPKTVYWYEVEGRFCTYLRINNQKLTENGITEEEIYQYLKEKYPNSFKPDKNQMVYDSKLKKQVITVYNNDLCKEEDLENEVYKDLPFKAFCEITTWKKETIKDIGGLEMFNQEYGLRFVTDNKSIFSEETIDRINNNKKPFVEKSYDVFKKLTWDYENFLKFVDDVDIFPILRRKKDKFIITVDLAEGLGMDYSVINLFRIDRKSNDVIEKHGHTFKKYCDFFSLHQCGLFRSNVHSVEEIAELLYVLCYDFLESENVKIVLELNKFGPELVMAMKHVFNDNNDFGANIFFKYKHRLDAVKEEIGLKVSGGNKETMVKSYKEVIENESIYVYEHNTIEELKRFVKNTTRAGNVTYKADSGNDDIIMSVVNLSTIFKKNWFIEVTEELYTELPFEIRAMFDKILNINTQRMNTDSMDYSSFFDIKKMVQSGIYTKSGNIIL